MSDLIAPQPHEFQAHILFSDETLERPMSPYFAIASEWEPDLEDVDEFEAAGTTWDVDRPSDHEDLSEYTKSVTKYWESAIATREEDSGEAYLEYQIPVYDVSDDKRNRRINFQFRPALPEAEHLETGEPIASLPEDLPHGIRVQIGSSNVAPEDVLDVLQELASAMDISPRFFRVPIIHEWSRVTGLAYYVRGRREDVHESIIGETGLLEDLSQFSSRREGSGSFKWDNTGAYGKRHAVALSPLALEHLEQPADVGKLLKSYLPKHPKEEAGDSPLQHPKIEVQYNRETTPGGISVAWLQEHTDEEETPLALEELSRRLQQYLLSALEWSSLPTSPDSDVWVSDDHFTPEALASTDVEIVSNPIPDATDELRDVATRELLQEPPTDADEDILRALTDGGRAESQDELAERAERSPSAVSRTLSKFNQLVTRLQGVDIADSVTRERLQELFATLEETVDVASRGLDRLSRQGDVPEDSALARWAQRWGAKVERDSGAYRLRLETGRLDERELLEVIRAGYRAAHQTIGVDEHDFTDSYVAWRDEDGDLARERKVGVWQGGRLRLLGIQEIDRLH